MVTISGFEAASLTKGSRIRMADLGGGEYTFTSTVWGNGKDNPTQAAGLAQCPGTYNSDFGATEGATAACDCYYFPVTDLCTHNADGEVCDGTARLDDPRPCTHTAAGTTKCHQTGVADNTGADCRDGTAINFACNFKGEDQAVAGTFPCRERMDELCNDGSMTEYAKCMQATKSVGAKWKVRAPPPPAPPDPTKHTPARAPARAPPPAWALPHPASATLAHRAGDGHATLANAGPVGASALPHLLGPVACRLIPSVSRRRRTPTASRSR